MGLRILLVEDNDELAGLVIAGLRANGYNVDRVALAADVEPVLSRGIFAAIILDLGLPDADGLVVLRDIRLKQHPVPVIALTARAGVRDRVDGLRAGADDYLTKPFAMEELVARLEALLRRPRELAGDVITLANLTFNTRERQAFIDGELCRLSPRERLLLELLIRRQGRVVPKKLVEDELFGLSDEGSANAVEVLVHRLRRQLENCRAQIHTVRGVGYLLSEKK